MDAGLVLLLGLLVLYFYWLLLNDMIDGSALHDEL